MFYRQLLFYMKCFSDGISYSAINSKTCDILDKSGSLASDLISKTGNLGLSGQYSLLWWQRPEKEFTFNLSICLTDYDGRHLGNHSTLGGFFNGLGEQCLFLSWSTVALTLPFPLRENCDGCLQRDKIVLACLKHWSAAACLLNLWTQYMIGMLGFGKRRNSYPGFQWDAVWFWRMYAQVFFWMMPVLVCLFFHMASFWFFSFMVGICCSMSPTWMYGSGTICIFIIIDISSILCCWLNFSKIGNATLWTIPVFKVLVQQLGLHFI